MASTKCGLYALALVIVFAFSFLLECFYHCRLIRSRADNIALAYTTLHALRISLAYLVMLMIMLFNDGVLIIRDALKFLLT
ncbi:hypothetical protein OPV22_015529 [Ensete ventricosum]|uniref:Uncharacterized protein n=1 Tax=Ensete ventricosum TaxID=4639 RepID=A0AAV8PM93_ENSVE|nr:hypothetical protein OPV22_015529 [Ensete ventricosum]